MDQILSLFTVLKSNNEYSSLEETFWDIGQKFTFLDIGQNSVVKRQFWYGPKLFESDQIILVLVQIYFEPIQAQGI